MRTQDKRLLHLHIPALPDNILLPIRLTLQETISQPYFCDIDCLLQNLSLKPETLLGQTATLSIISHEDEIQHVNGIIDSLSAGCVINQFFQRIKLRLVPQFYLLQHTRDCQFFTDMSVIEIFQQYCKYLGFSSYSLKICREYPKLSYKVQFNETAFQFISRILEEAGITYYFQHTQNNHTMVLMDNSVDFPVTHKSLTLPGASQLSESASQLCRWQEKLTMQPLQNKMGPLTNSVPKAWDYPIRTSVGQKQSQIRAEWQQVFSYPQDFSDSADRQNQQENKIKTFQWQQQIGEGAGDCPGLCAGSTFELEGRQHQYLVTAVQRQAHDYSWLSETMQQELKERIPQAHTCQFQFINLHQCSYVPPCTIARPIMPDFQSAFVASSNPDDFGRIKVIFPWDRRQKSGPWLPVAQPVAGHEFGTLFVPGQGQEVLVSYIAGDCDRPVIMGAVANADNPPAYDPAVNPNRTWIKSRSNHIVLDDSHGMEQFQLHAQRDYLEQVFNNASCHVTGDDSLQVQGDWLLQTLNEGIQFEARSIRLCGGGSEIMMDDQGIHLRGSPASGGRVNLLAKGAGALQPIARVGDPHQCPKQSAAVAHHGGPILKGATSITANGQAVARQGDKAYCRTETDVIQEGISSIHVNGKPVARLNHKLAHGGVITQGSPNVFVGEKPG